MVTAACLVVFKNWALLTALTLWAHLKQPTRFKTALFPSLPLFSVATTAIKHTSLLAKAWQRSGASVAVVVELYMSFGCTKIGHSYIHIMSRMLKNWKGCRKKSHKNTQKLGKMPLWRKNEGLHYQLTEKNEEWVLLASKYLHPEKNRTSQSSLVSVEHITRTKDQVKSFF